jgi:hypothetical protein
MCAKTVFPQADTPAVLTHWVGNPAVAPTGFEPASTA